MSNRARSSAPLPLPVRPVGDVRGVSSAFSLVAAYPAARRRNRPPDATVRTGTIVGGEASSPLRATGPSCPADGYDGPALTGVNSLARTSVMADAAAAKIENIRTVASASAGVNVVLHVSPTSSSDPLMTNKPS